MLKVRRTPRPKLHRAYISVEWSLDHAEPEFGYRLTQLMRRRFNVISDGSGVFIPRRVADVGFPLRRTLAQLHAITRAITTFAAEERVPVAIDLDLRRPED